MMIPVILAALVILALVARAGTINPPSAGGSPGNPPAQVPPSGDPGGGSIVPAITTAVITAAAPVVTEVATAAAGAVGTAVIGTIAAPAVVAPAAIAPTITAPAVAAPAAIAPTITAPAAPAAAPTSAAGLGPYLPYLAFGAIFALAGFTFHKTWSDPATGQGCCDTNMLGMSFNCRPIDAVECYYGIKLSAIPREKLVNQIFFEMQQLKGVVLRQKSHVTNARSDGTKTWAYTPGAAAWPNLPSLHHPAPFRILNAAEIAEYRKVKEAIIAFNKPISGQKTLIAYLCNKKDFLGRPLGPTRCREMSGRLTSPHYSSAYPITFSNWLY